MSKLLPMPQFFNPANADSWAYQPNLDKLRYAAVDWQRQHGILPSSAAQKRFHLLLIDDQNDFCFPGGTLYVAGRSGTGAIDDSRRTAEFIYREMNVITDITTTLDTHFAFQIFTPSFWQYADGTPIAANTLIPLDLIASGKVKPVPAMAQWLCEGNYSWLCKQVEFYAAELAKTGKYTLMAWPAHCVLGTQGHALVGIIQEARMFHSYVRTVQSNCEVKGGNPLTECYSVFGAEVKKRFDGKVLAQKNTAMIKRLLEADYVGVGGQAASHCTASSIDDLLTDIKVLDPKLAEKVYVITDLMSAVVIPQVNLDYTPDAEAAFQRFADAGMHLVKSTDPIESWPGIQLAA